MPENVQPQQVTAAQDLIAGGIAGSCSVIVGHPFDTYKVMLQTSAHSAPKKSLTISKLYRGMIPPLASAGVVNALIFSSFGESSRLWDDYFCPEEGSSHMNEKDATLHECEHARKIETHDHSSSWQKSFLCGSFAGAVQALVICPTEHVKCRLQTQHAIVGYKQTVYKGAFDAFDKILNSHGLRGLFRGFGCTAWREIPSFGLYFSTYDFVKDSVSGMLSSSKQRQYDGNDDSADSLHMWAASSLAGGFSGALTWSIIYPFDVIKTKIQTLPLDTPLEKRRITYIYRQTLEQHGWRIFFRGLGVTVLRAFPVNAIIFPLYEFTLQQLSKNNLGGTSVDPLTNS